MNKKSITPWANLATPYTRLFACLIDIIYLCITLFLSIGYFKFVNITPLSGVISAIISLLILAISSVGQIIFIHYHSASIGKFLLKLVVVDRQTCLPVSFNTYMTRFLQGQCMFLFVPFYFLIDNIGVFTNTRQTEHDLLVDTIVIQK
jgi:hypothetical protein